MKKIEEVLAESTPTVMVFEHVGGQNSSEVHYLVKELKDEFAGGVNFLKIDDSFNGKMKERYHITEYPTYILFKEGQELSRKSGDKSVAELEEMIKTAL